ncbi:hypothetical protein BC835DRAFT_1346211 [Cytidiella melzeri]|nr:hypothetical protein BC835DRAFT_1346211 [Cytidiella melzeri]
MRFSWHPLILFTAIVTGAFPTVTVFALPYSSTEPRNSVNPKPSTGPGDIPVMHVAHQIKRGPVQGEILTPHAEKIIDYSPLKNLPNGEREILLDNVERLVRSESDGKPSWKLEVGDQTYQYTASEVQAARQLAKAHAEGLQTSDVKYIAWNPSLGQE